MRLLTCTTSKCILLSSLLAVGTVLARRNSDPESYEDGSDLEHFVTRPDIAAPRYAVTKHHPDAIADGYWFVSPYTSLWNRPGFTGRREHVPCQTGAHIYDNDGVLIWSGACEYSNRNVHGFRPVTINGTQYLAFHQSGEDVGDGIDKQEASVLLNEHYEEHRRITQVPNMDMHEFHVLPDGKSAIYATQEVQVINVTNPENGSRAVIDPGFLEVDLTTNKTLFQWEGLGHGVSEEESWDLKGKAKMDQWWDAFHINSIDKDGDGNYYISLRHALGIYKISGADKSIIWRLGGNANQFKMDDGVAFRWQHHMRVRQHNSTHTIISLFDNRSEDEGRSLSTLTPETSIAKIILLDTLAMTATLLRSIPRPDAGQSHKLGSVQLLGPTDILPTQASVLAASVFTDWADAGYITEHDAQNSLLLSAHFLSPRFKSYRAYKFPFVGRPLTRPALKLLPLATDPAGNATASAFYASWNGATELRSWKFFGAQKRAGPYALLATVRKSGFETAWSVPGAVRFGYAEAVDGGGTLLQKSWRVPLEASSNRNIPVPETEFVGLSEEGGEEEEEEEVVVVVEEGASMGWEVVYIVVMVVVYGLAAFGAFCCVKDFLVPLWRERREKGRDVEGREGLLSGEQGEEEGEKA